MSQNEMILRHLQSGTPLSPLEALREFGCFRLAARVHELRARGHDIRQIDHPDGYAVYFIPSCRRCGGSGVMSEAWGINRPCTECQPAAPVTVVENEQRALWGDR